MTEVIVKWVLHAGRWSNVENNIYKVIVQIDWVLLGPAQLHHIKYETICNFKVNLHILTILKNMV